MLLIAILCTALGNTCFAVWSHRSLRADIRHAASALETIITGKVREVGPVEAQSQALAKQATDKALIRRSERQHTTALNI